MAGLCPFCAADTDSPPGATATCSRCGRRGASLAAALPTGGATAPSATATLVLDCFEPTAEFPAVDESPPIRHRIVWPRVIALAAITIVASVAAWGALHDVASRTAPSRDAQPAAIDDAAPASLPSTVATGPKLGDLRGLSEYAPAGATLAPPTSPQATTAARSTRRPRTPTRSDGGFVVVTGARRLPACPPVVCR